MPRYIGCEICGGRKYHKDSLCEPCVKRISKLDDLWGNHGKGKQTKTFSDFAAAIRRKLEKNIRRQA